MQSLKTESALFYQAMSGPAKVQVNRVSDFRSYVAAWHDPLHPLNAPDLDETANVGQSLHVYGTAKRILTKWHPEFSASLEPGIADVVTSIVAHTNWMTFSSCEGHLSLKDERQSTPRYLSLYPRDDRESGGMFEILSQICATANFYHKEKPVSLECFEAFVEADGTLYPINYLVYQLKVGFSWKDYFANIEAPYKTSLEVLKRLISAGPHSIVQIKPPTDCYQLVPLIGLAVFSLVAAYSF